jgi:putative membrane protein insertion efficiency factor
MKFLWNIFKSIIGAIFLLLIKIYQYLVSPILPNACRYTPTCSQYGVEAIKRHGPFKGGWLTLKRISRCNPWGGHGHDPVPD